MNKVVYILCFLMGMVLCFSEILEGRANAVIPAITVGGNNTAALKTDGTVWIWGRYDWHPNPDSVNCCYSNSDERTLTPLRIQELSSVIAISNGESHFVALKSDGTVWAWGCNWDDIISDDINRTSSTPVQIQGLSDIIAIESGMFHHLALKSDGTVWGWGSNGNAELGGCDYWEDCEDYYPAVQVHDLSNVIDLAADGAFSLALKSDGTVWGWGGNWDGELGCGDNVGHYYSPVQAKNLYDITAIAAGNGHCVALKSDGTVWAWGCNEYGQVGNGSTENCLMPTQVESLSDIIAIDAGGFTTVAINSDGTVWAWGDNRWGQLGDGSTTAHYTPVQVQIGPRVIGIATNGWHTVARKADGTVWAWGMNWDGELGDGTETDRTIPVQVLGSEGIGFFNLLGSVSDPSFDIKANNSDGPITVSLGTPVSITVSLNPANLSGQNADWWIVAHTPFISPNVWCSYVYPTGWQPGIHLYAQTPLFTFSSFEVLNMTLPVGDYTFYFALDDIDGAATGPWWGSDSVNVTVNEKNSNFFKNISNFISSSNEKYLDVLVDIYYLDLSHYEPFGSVDYGGIEAVRQCKALVNFYVKFILDTGLYLGIDSVIINNGLQLSNGDVGYKVIERKDNLSSISDLIAHGVNKGDVFFVKMEEDWGHYGIIYEVDVNANKIYVLDANSNFKGKIQIHELNPNWVSNMDVNRF